MWGDIFAPFLVAGGAADFEDAAVSAGEEREFGDAPFYGQVRSTLRSINPFIWEKDLILKYFIILARPRVSASHIEEAEQIWKKIFLFCRLSGAKSVASGLNMPNIVRCLFFVDISF
jgi:hypothetical protein